MDAVLNNTMTYDSDISYPPTPVPSVAPVIQQKVISAPVATKQPPVKSTKVVSNKPKSGTLWYIIIGLVSIMIIGGIVGIVYYMYKKNKGLFAPYSRPPPTGHDGTPSNGTQITLTADQQAQLKTNVQAAIDRVAARS